MIRQLENATSERKESVLRLCDWLGMDRLDRFIEYLEYWHQPLSEQEIEILRKVL